MVRKPKLWECFQELWISLCFFQGKENFLLSKTSRPGQWSTCHLIHYVRRFCTWGLSGWIVKLTTHVHLLQRLQLSGEIPLFSPHAFTTWKLSFALSLLSMTPYTIALKCKSECWVGKSVEDSGHAQSTYSVLPFTQEDNENLEYPQSNSQSPSQDSNWIPLEYKWKCYHWSACLVKEVPEMFHKCNRTGK